MSSPGVTFVVLSFEGPDRYALAGGLGSRIAGLTTALAQLGYPTHLFFVGDPTLPGEESAVDGRLHLHRWCQWISHYHPQGVYDGEERKLYDWNRSLPAWVVAHVMGPAIAAGQSVVLLAEEWHTAESVIRIHEMVTARGWNDRVRILWNANNVFGFDRIDWRRLRRAATVTTVSRYMRQILAERGAVEARVIPNGISETWLRETSASAIDWLRGVVDGRPLLVKVARWDPDKRWTAAVDAVAELRQAGTQPVLLARGGLEGYGAAVLARARADGLRVGVARWRGDRVRDMIEAVARVRGNEMIVLDTFLSQPQRKFLYRAADAVLANSGLEPFGLVGLETMAVGGVAFVGCTGEDYVTHGFDAISIQSESAREIVHYVRYLMDHREEAARIRRAGRLSARRYIWPAIPVRSLFHVLAERGPALAAPMVRSRRLRQPRPPVVQPGASTAPPPPLEPVLTTSA